MDDVNTRQYMVPKCSGDIYIIVIHLFNAWKAIVLSSGHLGFCIAGLSPETVVAYVNGSRDRLLWLPEVRCRGDEAAAQCDIPLLAGLRGMITSQ